MATRRGNEPSRIRYGEKTTLNAMAMYWQAETRPTAIPRSRMGNHRATVTVAMLRMMAWAMDNTAWLTKRNVGDWTSSTFIALPSTTRIELMRSDMVMPALWIKKEAGMAKTMNPPM